MNRVGEATRARIGLGGNKRKADVSPKKVDTKKRSALGDLTNAKKAAAALAGKDGASKKKGVTEKSKDVKVDKPSMIPVIHPEQPRVTRARTKSLKGNEEPMKPTTKAMEVPKPAPEPSRVLREMNTKPVARSTRSSVSLTKKQQNDSTSGEESLYQTAYSSPVLETSNYLSTEEQQNRENEMMTTDKVTASRVPEGVKDFDEETVNDPFQVGLYATDIFAYYKRREVRFPIRKYLDLQTELNKNMRSILVDWMVEVQESFEMNHETLYLAVKLVDMYLGKTLVKRDKLQLVGTTALYIAAKYDERCPPVIDDFCYICDDAYAQKDVIQMEEKMLRVLEFDIGVPLSYRFLRRYARCAKLDMEVLTLARYILEMSLMEYDFIDGLDSMMAAASLLLALKMTKVENPWTPTLQFYSTYKVEDLFDLTHRLYDFMRKPQAHLKTIRSKYSHKVFYEVAKTPLPDELKL